jgi:V8-like Glu-specific endopeptidase
MKYMAAVLLLVAAISAQNAPSANKGRHQDIPAISREANGAIVSIVMSDKDGQPIAKGSGFFISKDGHVLTNYHVIRNGSSAVIKLPSGAFFAVDGVLASDKDRDVAVIKAHGNDFRTLTLGDSDRLQVGEEVVAIGNPLSLESTVSNGIVSALRTVEDDGGKFVQITAPISPGSSGGPLFNMAGEVVGITTSHIKGGENLNFAIPINDVKPMLVARSSKSHAFPDEPEPAAAEQTTGPTLADTLQWMVRSSAHASDTSFKSASCCPDYNGYFHILKEDNSCHNFEILTVVTFVDRDKNSVTAMLTHVFNLEDMDPANIEQHRGSITVNTTNNQDRVTLEIDNAIDVDHLISHQLISKKVLHQGHADFYVDDDDNYRNRLAEAIKHAVILCGGKPSTF